MIALRTAASMRSAVQSDLDASLRALLALRMEQLSRGHNFDLSEVVEFLIVELGDTAHVVEAAAGYPILTSIVDGTRFGDADFTPCFEAFQDHHRWFEIAFEFTGGDYCSILFVPDDPGVEFDIHSFCLEYAGRADCS